jgi:Lar family restriction alleviation protein
MSDLLPCPFCGSTRVGIAATQEMENGKYIEEGRDWSVLCDGCGASCSAYCESEQEAEKAWNTRACPTSTGNVT